MQSTIHANEMDKLSPEITVIDFRETDRVFLIGVRNAETGTVLRHYFFGAGVSGAGVSGAGG